ncbi:MAG: DUF1800 domain-containing protein [Nocardioidaceae bacterium]|nr:DUF1800 domain-containing protein [Nocardioidaceae bacterium]
MSSQLATRAGAPAAPVAAAVAAAPTLSSLDRHVVNRFSYGYSRDLARQVAAAGGGRAWFLKQLSPGSIPDPAVAAMVSQRWFPVLHKSPSAQWKDHLSGRRKTWEAGWDLSRLSLARKVVSNRQVHEVMAEFWLNHLYVPSGEDRSSVHRYAYEDLVRRHALGRFSDLLAAAVVHPAMTGFLANDENHRGALNENLARELLELHTVGVGARYGEAGVQASARLLTGYTLDDFRTWRAGYDPRRHHVGAVRVLGRTFPNAGADGRATTQAYLRFLAMHDRTAARIARKLCVHFVSDQPSARIVAAVKAAYLRSGSDVRTTLRALVAHPDFAASRGAKTRTPIEDVVATARAVGAVPTRPTAAEDSTFVSHLGWMAEDIGYRPYTWPRPDGPPDTAAAWTSASRMLRTWELRFALPAGWWQSKNVRYAPRASFLPTAWPRRVDEVVSHVGLQMVGVRPSPAAVQAACRLLDKAPSDRIARAADVSEWDMVRIRGVLLNAPENLMR